MSSVIESILSAVILVAVLIGIGLAAASIVSRNAVTDVQQERSVHQEEQTDVALNAVLASTDNDSGLPINELIGYTMLTLNTKVDVKDKIIDVTNITKERMNIIYGSGNYYMTVKPIVKGVNLIFIIDNSPSMTGARNAIATKLGTVQTTIRNIIASAGEEKKVSVQIYILPDATSNGCDAFKNLGLPNVECIQLDAVSLYEPLKKQGWKLPSFGLSSYEVWRSEPHAATTDYFAQSDWAAGTALAALNFEKSPYLKSTTSINLIFPLSDELPQSSKANSCFLKTDQVDWFMCQLCDGTCPLTRSRNATMQAINITNKTTSKVYPLFSNNCDFSYPNDINGLSGSGTALTMNGYVKGFLDDPTRPLASYPTESWCKQDKCTGCTTKPTGDICFHDNCKDELLAQMQAMATATQNPITQTSGTVININDATTIPDKVIQAFSKVVATYDFQIGVKDETRDRFVYEKVIKLPNSQLGKIIVWIYNDKREICTKDKACVLNNGCDGAQICDHGNLSDICKQNNPLCAGAACTGEQLCLAEDGCVGTKACVSGVLSTLCTKVDSNCGPTCKNDCQQSGTSICRNVSPTIATNATYYCARDPKKDTCLRYRFFKECGDQCNYNGKLCYEMTCPWDRCNADGVCNPECATNPYCNGQKGINHWDPDCPSLTCPENCVQDPINAAANHCDDIAYNYCKFPSELCKQNSRCPTPPNPSTASCPGGTPTGGSCPTQTVWTWGQYEDSSGQTTCGPTPFGACCMDSNSPWGHSCVAFKTSPLNPTGPKYAMCVFERATMHIDDTNYLCSAGVLLACQKNPICKSSNPPTWCHTEQVVLGVTYVCDHDTGIWHW